MAISISDQIKSAKRELGYRQRVYPRWVAAKKMSQAKADHELACMAAIVASLELLAADGPAYRKVDAAT